MHVLQEIMIIGTPYLFGTLPSYFCPMDRSNNIKSNIQPPGWVFGVMWSILYILSGFFLLINIRQGISNGFNKDRLKILVMFVLSMILNAIWVPIFSCYKKKIMALYIIAIYILVTMLLILMCILSEDKLIRSSCIFMVPLLWWLCCALQLSLTTINLTQQTIDSKTLSVLETI
jgi:tryptophan-rich sensory protein